MADGRRTRPWPPAACAPPTSSAPVSASLGCASRETCGSSQPPCNSGGPASASCTDMPDGSSVSSSLLDTDLLLRAPSAITAAAASNGASGASGSQSSRAFSSSATRNTAAASGMVEDDATPLPDDTDTPARPSLSGSLRVATSKTGFIGSKSDASASASASATGAASSSSCCCTSGLSASGGFRIKNSSCSGSAAVDACVAATGV
mmetsp:Transcript_41884/g.105068  ORF Transcript_41884/g.105068 Transcript_41884/m.105068 type:complete len:206 (-) Transcript_41884:295-912(-)